MSLCQRYFVTSTLLAVKTHQNTFVHNFSKRGPILIEIGVQCLG